MHERLDNKFGPVGLASILNAWSSDRAGPQDLSEMSMLAIDRAFEDEGYRNNPSLKGIYAELFKMDEAQREAMREAHRVTDGAYTHRLDSRVWPGPPEWARSGDDLGE
jgi:hypothetical protein